MTRDGATVSDRTNPVRVDVPAEAGPPEPRTPPRTARLILEDGTECTGVSFGAPRSVAGEVVFNTGMVGYPETLTDPSYRGQILVCTYPLIGNYGVPDPPAAGDDPHPPFESDRIQVAGLIVADYSAEHSHWSAAGSLASWLAGDGIPALTGIDTRGLTKRLRERGSMLGRIEFDGDPVEMDDPNARNLVAEVSVGEVRRYGQGAGRRIMLLDCGCKENIIQSLVRRGVEVIRVPWDFDPDGREIDGLMISNGPGDPALVGKTVERIRWALARDIPTFGVCMGNQLLARAIGASTYKLKYGHRGQNQPVIESGTKRCYITSQNHGYAVDTDSLPRDWRPWFENLNDGTNEGIHHGWKPFRSVQFHPEAQPGPTDTDFLFDDFVRILSR